MAQASKNKLGIWTSTSLVVGSMIGSGVFLVPAAMASFGSVSLLGWLFSAVGAFFIALIGIWIFITFIPLTWNQDFKVPGTHVPLVTSFIGAVISILVVHFLKVVFGRKGRPAKA